MNSERQSEDADALSTIIACVSQLPESGQERVLRAAISYFGLDLSVGRDWPPRAPRHPEETGAATPKKLFSETVDLTPKQFLIEKAPKTEIERVACLAYYLAHYRGLPQFKTGDISTLNTEAAHRKFSNPSYAINNAVQAGLLVSGTAGHKQLSALGEQYVSKLPDRSAARELPKPHRPRRTKPSKRTRRISPKQEN